MAVSQICKSVGYKSIQVSALDTLTLVATKYLQAIAKSASSYSNTSNRTQSNLFDLTLALQDLVSLHTCTLFTTGGIIRDLANFVSFHDEIPFAKPIPRPRRSIPLWNSTGSSSSSSSSHVPQWLPMFPDVNNNSSVNERKCGESLWEDSVLAGGGKIETESVSNGKKGKLELDLGGVEREKVRFRIRAKEEEEEWLQEKKKIVFTFIKGKYASVNFQAASFELEH
uniref:Bromodomain associated domain-containing protein n=1 Tax=Fagus sylvatica TaxID=28930 RepID=A0A2N9GLP1_FAGSY